MTYEAIAVSGAGWVRALADEDLKPFGIDIKPEVADSIEGVVTQLDEIIELMRGDRFAELVQLSPLTSQLVVKCNELAFSFPGPR